MASRTSTSSATTANRLRTKTSELSDLLRWREHSNTLDVGTAMSEPSTSPAKSKRRLPFLGLRKKHDDVETTSSSSNPQPSQAISTASSSSAVAGASRNLYHPPSAFSPPTTNLRSTSPATLKPSRSTTPTSPVLAPRTSDETTRSSREKRAPDGPEITVSTPSPEKTAPVGRLNGSLRSKPTPASSSKSPRTSQALSDGEVGRTQPRERKASFFDRLKSNRADLSRTPSVQSSKKGGIEVLSDPEVPSRPRKPSGPISQPTTKPASPTSKDSSLAKSRLTPSPTSLRRQSLLPSASATRQRSDSVSSYRSISTSLANGQDATANGIASDSAPAFRVGLPPSRLGSARPIARSTTSATRAPSKRVSPTPSSPSVPNSSFPLPKTANLAPAQASSVLPPSPSAHLLKAPHTRARSSSDSKVLRKAIASASDTTTQEGSTTKSERHQSLRASSLAKSPSVGAPPTGPLPELPTTPTASSAVPPPHPPSLTSVAASTVGLALPKPDVPTTPTQVASRPTLRTISSNASLATKAKKSTEDTSRKTANKARSVTPSTKAPSVKKASSLTSKAQPSLPQLAPTPANIYALQSENAALKEKIETLERAARRHEREIRGLRWLVVNGSNASFANMGQSPDKVARPTLSPPLSATSFGSTAFSDGEALSDGTTDVATRSEISRGFESDTGVQYLSLREAAGSPVSYTSASEASGNELSARKRSTALDRARAVREQAGKVLGRDASLDTPELHAIHESVGASPIEEVSEDSASSATPTTSFAAPPEPSLLTAPQPPAEATRRSKEENRASRVFKRLSGISVSGASIKAELGVGSKNSDDDSRAQKPSRLEPPQSIEQVLQGRRESMRSMDDMLDKLKSFKHFSSPHSRS